MPELIPNDMPPDGPSTRWRGPWRVVGFVVGILMVLGMLAAVGHSLFTAWREGA